MLTRAAIGSIAEIFRFFSGFLAALCLPDMDAAVRD